MNNGVSNNNQNGQVNGTVVVDPNAIAAATQSTNVVTPVSTVNVNNATAATVQNVGVVSQQTIDAVVPPSNVSNIPPTGDAQTPAKVKKKFSLSLLLFIVLVGVSAYAYFSINNYKNELESVRYNCSPVRREEEVELDVNSTLVNELYAKVKTNSREDLGNPYFDDNLKLYLAYRQILDYEKYNSNCNLFNNTAMENYSCVSNKTFVPNAFKPEVLEREYKKLFGEDSYFQHRNIQLSNFCLGGYQYIPDRGEYVQGECTRNISNSYDVEKKITKAFSVNNIVVLEEDVNYYENEKVNVPSSLKSGIYTYTFRLDSNYNYILESKVYRSKY